MINLIQVDKTYHIISRKSEQQNSMKNLKCKSSDLFRGLEGDILRKRQGCGEARNQKFCHFGKKNGKQEAGAEQGWKLKAGNRCKIIFGFSNCSFFRLFFRFKLYICKEAGSQQLKVSPFFKEKLGINFQLLASHCLISFQRATSHFFSKSSKNSSYWLAASSFFANVKLETKSLEN